MKATMNAKPQKKTGAQTSRSRFNRSLPPKERLSYLDAALNLLSYSVEKALGFHRVTNSTHRPAQMEVRKR